VRFTVRDDHVIESDAGICLEHSIQWFEKFGTMTGLRSGFFDGSDATENIPRTS
jgi:hypothetical protein